MKNVQLCSKDLVGGLLAHHIAEILATRGLPYEQATLITDGLRGLALRSYRRKGFTVLPHKNPYGYPILELEMIKNQGEPFVRAIANRLSHPHS